MRAEDFRTAVGGMRKEVDGEGNAKMKIQKPQEFRSIVK